MKIVSLLGSTGSIGTQTLEVIAANPDKFKINAITAHSNDVLLQEQIEFFKPEIAVLTDKEAANRLIRRYRGQVAILTGEDGLIEAAAHPNSTIVLSAIVGFAGLRPAIAALEARKDLALANKETLVAAGSLITQLAAKNNCRILPVDSEHSAILQCLNGETSKNIKRLILTASGGPFRGLSAELLKSVTVEQCLQHPNWKMGKKITVDSATLVNKGLEVIEARWLFNVDYDHIDVLVHPQSIVHSMVEFVDGAVIAQLGVPDMRIPIQYAFTYPDRLPAPIPSVDFLKAGSLTFLQPDHDAFPGLALAYKAGRIGGTLPCVYNAANEAAVHGFLNRKIHFLDIVRVIETTLNNHTMNPSPDFSCLFDADQWARAFASALIRSL
jgi:1-deoxy-D-xylulose-5-phosphate reductoisomerase